jgi:hypothetical protein
MKKILLGCTTGASLMTAAAVYGDLPEMIIPALLVSVAIATETTMPANPPTPPAAAPSPAEGAHALTYR